MTKSDKLAMMAYSGTCRCGRRVTYALPSMWVRDDNRGKWIRCAGCRSLTYCPREKDEGVTERTYSSPLAVDADDPRVTTFP